MSSKADVRRVAGSAYWREADARVIVEAWHQGGETLAGFAQRHGVDARRLARWSARLRRTAPAAVRFHPVRLAAEGVESRQAGLIEIELGGGRRVRLHPGFETDDLRRVLAVIEEAARC